MAASAWQTTPLRVSPGAPGPSARRQLANLWGNVSWEPRQFSFRFVRVAFAWRLRLPRNRRTSNGFLMVMLGEDSGVCDRRILRSAAFAARKPFDHPVAGDAFGHELRMRLHSSVPLPDGLASIGRTGHELEARTSGSLDQVLAVEKNSVAVVDNGHQT